MSSQPVRGHGALAVIVAAMMVLALAASPAFAAQVRFFHAVPGSPPVSLGAGGSTIASGIGFGRASAYQEVESGTADFTLTEAAGSPNPLAEASESLSGDRRYTVIATGTSDDIRLRVFADPSASGGRARVRVINAAPEVGSPTLRAGREVLARSLRFGRSTPARALEPGIYRLSAEPARGGSGPLAELPGASLAAGSSYTAVLAGSAGEATRFVLLSDATAAPTGAPQTGLGGLAGDQGPPWALVLIAAALAGLLGGGIHRLAGRSRAHRG